MKAMTASTQQLKQALQNSPMADAPEVRAAAAASSRVLRGRFRARRLAYAYSASGGGWTEQEIVNHLVLAHSLV